MDSITLLEKQGFRLFEFRSLIGGQSYRDIAFFVYPLPRSPRATCSKYNDPSNTLTTLNNLRPKAL